MSKSFDRLLKAAKEMRASVEPDANGWMPIDTANKHDFCMWVSDGFSMSLAFWLNGKEFENHGSLDGGWRTFDYCATKDGTDLYFFPTHWQPTPKPPVVP